MLERVPIESTREAKMAVALYASNEITIVSSMVCCWAYLYKQRWRYLKPRPLIATTIIILLTVITFGLQLAYPEVLHAFRRDAAAMRSGEWWRLITPLFVQPWGVTQFGFNMLFLGVFLPMAERIYGARIWLLYFVPGLVGQFVNFWWDPHGGGSSPAIFGVIGSVLTYVLVHRKEAPKQYVWFALAGLFGAVLMCFARSGHGPSLLMGGLLASLFCRSSRKEQPDTALEVVAESAGV